MTGKVVSLDKPDGADNEKYYLVKREDGEEVKYSPSELKLKEAPLGRFMTMYSK